MACEDSGRLSLRNEIGYIRLQHATALILDATPCGNNLVDSADAAVLLYSRFHTISRSWGMDLMTLRSHELACELDLQPSQDRKPGEVECTWVVFHGGGATGVAYCCRSKMNKIEFVWYYLVLVVDQETLVRT